MVKSIITRNKDTVCFTFSKEMVQKLNSLPRTIAPSKSSFMEGLLKQYFNQKEKAERNG